MSLRWSEEVKGHAASFPEDASQNRRIVGVGRDLKKLSSPSLNLFHLQQLQKVSLFQYKYFWNTYTWDLSQMHTLLEFWGTLTQFRKQSKNATKDLELGKKKKKKPKTFWILLYSKTKWPHHWGRKKLLGRWSDDQLQKMELILVAGKTDIWKGKLIIKY